MSVVEAIMYTSVLLLTWLAPLCAGQMFDMSDGNDEGVMFPCEDGWGGNWRFESATLYPGGPTSGLVVSSDPTSATCLQAPDTITVTRNSVFNILVHMPYVGSWEAVRVMLIDARESWRQYIWLRIPGPIPENQRWVEMTRTLPAEIPPGNYKVSSLSSKI